MTTELVRVSDHRPIMDLVLDGLTSEHSRRAYKRSLLDFIAWRETQGNPPLIKATVNRYKVEVLEAAGLAPSTINQRLSAIRKLATEAADNDIMPQEQANGINKIKGVKSAGTRLGNWLDREAAQAALDLPDTTTLKGLRDRAILAVLLGAGLRRTEAADLTFDQVQMREARWVIVDLTGKGNRVRSIPIAAWVKVALDGWAEAAGIDSGKVFRPMNRWGDLDGDQVTSQLIYRVAAEYVPDNVAAHDLRRTFAKLAHIGGAPVEQIQLTLGHASLKTTEIYLGIEQDLTDAPSDKLGLRL